MRKATPQQGRGEKDGGMVSRDRQAGRAEPCPVSIYSRDLLKGTVIQVKEVPGGGDGKTTGLSGNPLQQAGFLLPARIYFFIFILLCE